MTKDCGNGRSARVGTAKSQHNSYLVEHRLAAVIWTTVTILTILMK